MSREVGGKAEPVIMGDCRSWRYITSLVHIHTGTTLYIYIPLCQRYLLGLLAMIKCSIHTSMPKWAIHTHFENKKSDVNCKCVDPNQVDSPTWTSSPSRRASRPSPEAARGPAALRAPRRRLPGADAAQRHRLD